jgi:hypothetical protein
MKRSRRFDGVGPTRITRGSGFAPLKVAVERLVVDLCVLDRTRAGHVTPRPVSRRAKAASPVQRVLSARGINLGTRPLRAVTSGSTDRSDTAKVESRVWTRSTGFHRGGQRPPCRKQRAIGPARHLFLHSRPQGDRHGEPGLLVEAAWHHKPRYVIGKTMRERWDLAPAAARIRGDEGNRRLHDRWVRFIARKKKPRPEHHPGRAPHPAH